MNVEWLTEALIRFTKNGQSVEEAADFLMMGGSPQEMVDKAVDRYQKRINAISEALRTGSMRDTDHQDWYPGPAANDVFWPRLHNYLLETKRWPGEVVRSVDDASTRILSLLHPPWREQFSTRGLVLGYVQSGKTANFTAVAAKGADVGFKLFIVLSGLHNGLRSQTQQRLEQELVELNPGHWHHLTTVEKDFEPQGNATAFLAELGQQRVLCVMKKNAHRLRLLLDWLRTAQPDVLARCPTLVIDDEADQASVDTSKTEDPSIINGLILDILRVLPRAAYVAYTATPFANILSDTSSQENLYPRHFIVDLPRPDGYFGAERIFGTGYVDDDGEVDDGLDCLRVIPAAEVEHLKPARRDDRATFQPALTQSLSKALLWFWLSAAARLARGQRNQHMSMLIHTTLYTDVHERFEDLLTRERDRIAGLYGSRLRSDAAVLWKRETRKISAEMMGEQPVSFEQVWEKLPEALASTQIIIDNARSENRLSFPDDRGSIQIVVGGNTLSRGLTIEGLMVSYFIRASALYDTLLQMGRWFGYRRGYADLPRIWMTEDLQDAFQHLARVELEIREDIARYELENLTPTEFAPFIQTHSTLAVTSPLKMQYAVTCKMSFSGAVKQTTYFHHLDADWLRNNIQAAGALLKASAGRVGVERVWGRHRLYRDLPAELILAFLASYRVDERHADLQPDQLRGYIEEQIKKGSLKRWNVGVISQLRATAGTWDGLLPGGESVNLINRARFGTAEPANLKAILNPTDRVMDFGLDKATTTSPSGDESFARWAARIRGAQTVDPATGRGTPLLLLYPISGDSKPRSESGQRRPLKAVEHVVGMALLFPATRNLTPQSYVTADLSRLDEDREVVEYQSEA